MTKGFASSLFLSLTLCFVPAFFLSAQEIESGDYLSKVSSLTNKVRAYDLRAQSMEELVQTYPNKAFPLLLSLLKDPEEETALRYLAAQKLTGINLERAAGALREILNDRSRDPLARRMALAELAATRPGDMRQLIRNFLEDRSEDAAIRQYALGLYGNSDEKDKIQKLRGWVQSKEETLAMRTNALFLLESLGDLDFVRSSVHGFLSDRKESEDLRKNCVVIAERINDRGSIPLLARIAKDSSESSVLRQLAASTLERMGDKI